MLDGSMVGAHKNGLKEGSYHRIHIIFLRRLVKLARGQLPWKQTTRGLLAVDYFCKDRDNGKFAGKNVKCMASLNLAEKEWAIQHANAWSCQTFILSPIPKNGFVGPFLAIISTKLQFGHECCSKMWEILDVFRKKFVKPRNPRSSVIVGGTFDF